MTIIVPLLVIFLVVFGAGSLLIGFTSLAAVIKRLIEFHKQLFAAW